MTDGSAGNRDFFVSFNSADRGWATWIAWTLEEAGYSVFFQDWDFKGNFVLEMDGAHTRSRRTIAVLSPDYLTSRFTAPEWAARFAEDATSQHDLLIPVRVRPCELEGLLAQRVYVELVGCDQAMAKKRLLDRVSGIRTKPGEPPLFPGEVRHEVVTKKPAYPSPYPGLTPFKTDQAPFFFGRERETEKLVRWLRDPDCRFLAVVGASGTGKSSLIYAGLIPRLHAGDAIDGRETWCVRSFKLGSLGENPFLALAAYGLEPLLPQYNRNANDLAGELERSPDSIARFVDQALAEASASAKLVWFIDQFEELFTQAKDEYRDGFVDLLAVAVCHPRVRVLATLREGFQSHALGYPKLATLLQTKTGTFPLGRPGKDALRDMIRCPAEVAGLAIEDDLVEAIIGDAGDDLGALPLVAFCLRRLWLSVDRGVPQPRMTLHTYTLIEQLQGAIAKHADELLKDLRQREGADLKNKLGVIFAALVTVDEAGQAIRKRTLRSPALDGVGELVGKLINGGLLCAQRDKDNRETVEFVQDKLLDSWPDLKRWIDENLRDIILWRLLADAAYTWRNAPRRHRNAYLWRSYRLKVARELVKRWRYDPAKIETNNIILFMRSSTVRKWKVIASTGFVVSALSIINFALIMVYVTPSSLNRTAMPVGSFAHNPFDLYDVLGNVWEWTDDCLTLTDRSARAAAPDEWCLARGGSLDNYEEWKVRASYRLALAKEHKVATVGFRVARKVDDAEKRKVWKVLQDCSDCPKMVILQGGSFTVRAPPRETDPCEKEEPQPETTLDPFAIGQYEVTVQEWNACVSEKGCEEKEKASENSINNHRPITSVSWHDAGKYIAWLESRTGKEYRLPEGAEWEYATRGNTLTCRWWGDELGHGNANCEGCGLTWKQFFDWLF